VPLAAESAQELHSLHTEIADAIRDGALLGPTPAAVPIDRTIIGEAIEAAESRLREPLRSGLYPGLHNRGHMRIAGLSTAPAGSTDVAVMADPTVAIRDPIFWRWHKGIDDLAFSWQETQAPYPLNDLPPVAIRDAIGGDASAWNSPDVYLVTRAQFDDSTQARTKIETALLGDHADTAVGDGTVRGLRGYRLASALNTRFDSTRIGNRNVSYLTHDPFGYAVRIANHSDAAVSVTVRVFLCPEASAQRRSAWIELDKVLHDVPAGAQSVLYRPDTEFSVIKKPAEQSADSVLEGGQDPEDGDYCVCGWPWTLVIPRGTPEGLPYRLVVICTDATKDQVPAAHSCGSMSYCGAVDRYPDTRDMGYPFSRPMPAGIEATVLNQQAIAGRSLTIQHIE
jgi:hypothetical protein